MSVIFTPRARSSRWKALWPLALLLAVSIIGGIWLWRAWPQVLMQSAVWQRSLNLELSRLLQAVAENPAAAGLSLLGFSFVYGVLHALGPGHGKIVITTWLATHPAKLKSSIGLTLAASLLQGLVAIALVVVVLALLQLPARQLHLSSFWLEKGSYLLVGALGLLLCWRALKKLRLLLRRPTFTAFTPHHVHNEHCGCGHQHLPAPEQLQAGDDWRARAASACRWRSDALVFRFSADDKESLWPQISFLPRRAGGSIMAAPAPPGCWRAWRSYSGFQPWPAGGRQIWCVSTTPCRMLCDSGWRVSRIFRWWPTPP